MFKNFTRKTLYFFSKINSYLFACVQNFYDNFIIYEWKISFFLNINQLEFNPYSRAVYKQIPVGSSQEDICKIFNNLDSKALLNDIKKNGIIDPLLVELKKQQISNKFYCYYRAIDDWQQ